MENINIVRMLEDTADSMIPKDKLEDMTETRIKEIVESMAPFVEQIQSIKIDQSHIEMAIANLEAKYAITMDTGVLLKEDNYKKWYFNSKAERGTAYWDRYNRYLERDVKLPKKVINKIEEASEDIMDVLGDPYSETGFQRKGLVIGAVQSGKTSNYTALINKAADSGYKIIILLTGTIEKLRKQTQGRIDEGFVGMDSRIVLENKKKPSQNTYLGVGQYNRSISVASFTTTEKDFTSTGLNVKLTSFSDPIIFVVKKNKAILEKLNKWLKNKNADSNGTIDLPMLLIDDEADNASVNTNNPDVSPTAINNEIRALLRLFNKYSYIGFTATPFANIFIDPQIGTEDNDDLFPKDFIYLLEQPSNYIGPTQMYREDGEYHFMVRHNDDMEEKLELKHKNGTRMAGLPNSLKDAINLFLLANAIRDLRGHNHKHRSMLIHVSRFITVQQDVQEQVKSYFNFAKEQIKNYGLAKDEVPYIQELHKLFEKEYGTTRTEEYDKKHPVKENWNDVKRVLFKAISPIQVSTVNSNSAVQRMNYEEYDEGLRLIAIGGLSLARGLTLEGLMVSYFYRNTKMYDTLMQMGRWFGYRDGYTDLCRLWTSSESAGWYEHIAEATEELRNEIRNMVWQNKRPIDFGLRVRSAEDTPLIITARNKLRHSEQIKLVRQLNGRMIETPILPSNFGDIEANNLIIEKWLINNNKYLIKDPSILGIDKPTFKDVPKDAITDLLMALEYPYMNEFSKENSVLVNEIKKSPSKIFNNWDVVVATNKTKNNKNTIRFGNIPITPITRSFDFFGTGHYIRMSKSKKRLGSTEYALTGLLKEEKEAIDNRVNKLLQGQLNKRGSQKSPTQNMYFNTGIPRNPLVVIYPVQLKDSEGTDSEVDKYVKNAKQLVTGISIGIPDIKGVQPQTYEYLVNKVYQMELIEGSSNEKDWDSAYDEDEDEFND